MIDIIDIVDAFKSVILYVRVDELPNGGFAIMGCRFRGGWVEMERFDTLAEAVSVARYIPVRSDRAIMCHCSCNVVAGSRLEFACIWPWERDSETVWQVFGKVRRQLAFKNLSVHGSIEDALSAAVAVEVEKPVVGFGREHPFLSVARQIKEKIAEARSA